MTSHQNNDDDNKRVASISKIVQNWHYKLQNKISFATKLRAVICTNCIHSIIVLSGFQWPFWIELLMNHSMLMGYICDFDLICKLKITWLKDNYSNYIQKSARGKFQLFILSSLSLINFAIPFTIRKLIFFCASSRTFSFLFNALKSSENWSFKNGN